MADSQASGERFWLSVYVRNFGGPSEATTLRFILLPDKTSPPSSGAEVGAVAVPALATRQGAHRPAYSHGQVNLKAPPTLGTYYYVACVDAVAEESDATDNCTAFGGVEVKP